MHNTASKSGTPLYLISHIFLLTPQIQNYQTTTPNHLTPHRNWDLTSQMINAVTSSKPDSDYLYPGASQSHSP